MDKVTWQRMWRCSIMVMVLASIFYGLFYLSGNVSEAVKLEIKGRILLNISQRWPDIFLFGLITATTVFSITKLGKMNEEKFIPHLFAFIVPVLIGNLLGILAILTVGFNFAFFIILLCYVIGVLLIPILLFFENIRLICKWAWPARTTKTV